MKALQDQLFAASLAAVQDVEAAVLASSDAKSNLAKLQQVTTEQGANILTKTSAEQATLVVEGWKALLPQLITK